MQRSRPACFKNPLHHGRSSILCDNIHRLTYVRSAVRVAVASRRGGFCRGPAAAPMKTGGSIEPIRRNSATFYVFSCKTTKENFRAGTLRRRIWVAAPGAPQGPDRLTSALPGFTGCSSFPFPASRPCLRASFWTRHSAEVTSNSLRVAGVAGIPDSRPREDPVGLVKWLREAGVLGSAAMNQAPARIHPSPITSKTHAGITIMRIAGYLNFQSQGVDGVPEPNAVVNPSEPGAEKKELPDFSVCLRPSGPR